MEELIPVSSATESVIKTLLATFNFNSQNTRISRATRPKLELRDSWKTQPLDATETDRWDLICAKFPAVSQADYRERHALRPVPSIACGCCR